MARPTSRATLIDFCKRQLGDGAIDINITEDQENDALDTALQFYQEYHSDATVKQYRKQKITAKDVTNRYITIPDSIIFVTRVLPFSSISSNADQFSTDYQMRTAAINNVQYFGDMVSYEMARQHMALIDMEFNGLDQLTRFSRHMNRLIIDSAWGTKIKVDDYVVVEGYELVDPETYPEVYNDMFLKEYLTALIKKQWGNNLKKFQGVVLPGGVTFDGQTIYLEAVEELKTLKEEMSSKWECPPLFFVG
jgi:hypothetical protein